ncbi:MAG: cysteine hydrolase [Proteobacteria bacterium]|nr:cysteine hydrolase [Pseudomonadota bacterium]MBU4326899.1 cysteine hydrolase [Pseudomonadota bacterium]
MNTCLIVVDLQNDYFPGGTMELLGIKEAAANAQLLLGEWRKAKLPVIHVQHIAAQPGATFFLAETEGAKINKMVTPLEDEKVVIKNFPNSFRDTTLLEILKNIKTENLLICGAMSHMCIDATTRAAFDLGFNCTVAEDACATKDLILKGKTIRASDVHASFMAALSAPYAKVLTTQEIIKSMVE